MIVTLETIKPLIRDFIAENLDEAFKAVYWQGERLDEPQKPYCMLTELTDNPTRPVAEYQGGILETGVEKDVEEYRQANITVGVYVDGLNDYDIQKNFAYAQCDNLNSLFRRKDIALTFYYKGISINSVSGVRPLTEIVEGGYLYRYEFDLGLGYSKNSTYLIKYGERIEVDLQSPDNPKGNIHFLVSQNGVIDTNVTM